MKIEIFTLADFAVDYGGKLSVTGSFDTISSRSFPVHHGFCSIALRLRFDRSEAGQKIIQILIVDPSGISITPTVEIKANVTGTPKANTSTIHVVANLSGQRFDAPGDYAVQLWVDGELKNTMPLYVRDIAG